MSLKLFNEMKGKIYLYTIPNGGSYIYQRDSYDDYGEYVKFRVVDPLNSLFDKGELFTELDNNESFVYKSSFEVTDIYKTPMWNIVYGN